MGKLVTRIIWNALSLVALVLAGLWGYNHFIENNTGTETTTISTSEVLEAIKHVNKQIFIEHYNAVDVQHTEVPKSWISILGIKQEFIALVRGRVPAGFDLYQLTTGDIWISSNNERAQLTLNPPIIFEENVAIDFENCRILAQKDICPDFICSNSLEAYQSQILPEGRDLLIEYARKNGILEQAAQDGKLYYEQLLKSLGFKEVRVIVKGYDL